MPSLVAGYAPAAIPEPGEEATGTVDGGRDPRAGVQLHTARLVIPQGRPAPPELRTPGVDDRPAFHPASAYYLRDPSDTDADHWTANHGEHVAQVAGAAQPHGAQAPEPPIYGSTWRLEPQPADTGLYVGVQVR